MKNVLIFILISITISFADIAEVTIINTVSGTSFNVEIDNYQVAEGVKSNQNRFETFSIPANAIAKVLVDKEIITEKNLDLKDSGSYHLSIIKSASSKSGISLSVVEINKNIFKTDQYAPADNFELSDLFSGRKDSYNLLGYSENESNDEVRGSREIKTASLNVVDNNRIQPNVFALNQNYPNPFNPTTSISFDVFELSNISLNIYDLNGRLVKNLMSGNLSQGTYNIAWNGKNANGASVAGGVYLYSITSNNSTIVKKMSLIK